jgi:Mg2+ and Co2+ transporter CorA
MSLQINYSINENKINDWLGELDQDRKKIFDDIKNSKSSDSIKESKLKSIENIQKQLISYKRLLNKEKDGKDKY